MTSAFIQDTLRTDRIPTGSAQHHPAAPGSSRPARSAVADAPKIIQADAQGGLWVLGADGQRVPLEAFKAQAHRQAYALRDEMLANAARSVLGALARLWGKAGALTAKPV